MSVASSSGGASSTINAVVSDPAARPIPTAGSASQLVFFEQPGNGVSGSPFHPQPVVAVEDAAGNVVSSDLSDVTLTLNTVSGPAGATLSSTCTGSEFFGIVTFSNCSILKAGTYTIDGHRHVPARHLDHKQYLHRQRGSAQSNWCSPPSRTTRPVA